MCGGYGGCGGCGGFNGMCGGCCTPMAGKYTKECFDLLARRRKCLNLSKKPDCDAESECKWDDGICQPKSDSQVAAEKREKELAIEKKCAALATDAPCKADKECKWDDKATPAKCVAA